MFKLILNKKQLSKALRRLQKYDKWQHAWNIVRKAKPHTNKNNCEHYEKWHHNGMKTEIMKNTQGCKTITNNLKQNNKTQKNGETHEKTTKTFNTLKTR
jgi:DNA-binding transcriptional regulator GbsR (MarR family)